MYAKSFWVPLALLALVATSALCSLPTADESGVESGNKTPKSAHLFTDTCGECQQIIQRLADVAGDPQKVMELKALLTVLCHETSYESECKLFVSHIDKFLDELLPYLRQPHTVCKWIHMCDNTRIEQFHRVGLLYAKKYVNRVQGAKDLICEECQFAAHELQKYVDDPTYQSEAKQWLSENVCARLEHYQGTCDTILDQVMPQFWTEMHDLLKDAKQFCVEIDLCEPTERPLVSSSGSMSANNGQQSQVPAQNAEPTTGSRRQQRKKVSKRVISTLFSADDE